MLSFSFPNWEIHNSKTPIALLIHPTRKMQAYQLKPLGGKYFYIREGRRFEGIFELDPAMAYHYSKTPVYVFDSRNSKPISPVLVNELAKWAKKNKLTKIKPKDKIHGEKLQKLQDKTNPENALLTLNEDAKKSKAKMREYLDDLAKVENIPADQIGYVLTNFLVEQEMLTPEEKGIIDSKLQNQTMDNVGLINYLKNRETIQVSTPLEQDCSKFLDDFGSYNPDQLASFVDRLRRDDKGLKSLTSTPVKNWIPASIILALLVGGSIAVAVVLQNAGDFHKLIPNIMPDQKPPQVENKTTPEPPPMLQPSPIVQIPPPVEVPAVIEVPPAPNPAIPEIIAPPPVEEPQVEPEPEPVQRPTLPPLP
jgi:hypothetical protein